VARRIYGASQVIADKKVRARLEQLQAAGYGRLPICVAKTQSSFSGDPALRGAPEGHTLTLREVRLAAGARFVVMICGDILTMPGLPATPAAHAISVTDDGRITGLS
jgi:formate--tetrahydrofolate ligase